MEKIDPSKVHVMTDYEIFHEKATRYCEQDTEASFSVLEGLIGAAFHINIHDFAQNETDLHRQTASEMFHVPYDEVTPEQRQIAKDRNFIKCYSYKPSSHERGAEDLALGDGVDLEV